MENEALAAMFRENTKELLERLSALGYTVSGVQAFQLRDPDSPQEFIEKGVEPLKRSSFDVII